MKNMEDIDSNCIYKKYILLNFFSKSMSKESKSRGTKKVDMTLRG